MVLNRLKIIKFRPFAAVWHNNSEFTPKIGNKLKFLSVFFYNNLN